LPKVTSLALGQTGELFHVSRMWGCFNVDRDPRASANHAAQTLPRLGLVDEVGDRHASQSGGCILRLGCIV
jgi:hypothetical protein